MKTIFVVTALCINAVSSINAQTIKVFHENEDRGFVLYANNDEIYPVSLSLELKLSNLDFSEEDKRLFIIPAKTDKFKIGALTAVKKTDRTNFTYQFKTAMGDVTAVYDTSFVYDLPYQKGKRFELYQGYNGSISHQNQNALDFTMPEGTEILAAREGIVVQIVQNNTESCPRQECSKYNNYILIMHPDGSFAYYGHIKYNGAKRLPGDHVTKGDVIAYSGNVGWSDGPHLHFACYLNRFEKQQTLETKFRIGKGDKIVMLEEGKDYKRDY